MGCGAGTLEGRRFLSTTSIAHPMQVPNVAAPLLSRDEAAPSAHDRGRRDTFSVDAMQTVSVAVYTAAVASSSPLTFHCHFVEHEDAGMMGQFITLSSGPAQ